MALYWIPMLAGKMNELWSEFEGQTIDDFVLGEIIGTSKTSAVYATQFRDELAAVKLRLVEGSGGDRGRGLWVAASELSHPNVIRVYATGAGEISGHLIEYIVMERADETLAGALANRALADSEMRELLTPALAAISYLHQNRFLHGSLHPSNVLGVNDTLKLSSDNLLRVGEVVSDRPRSPYDPPEAYQGPASPAWDSWSIGALLLHSGTLQYPEIRDGKIEFPELEQPFDEIVRHTLIIEPEQRWSIMQISDAFQGKLVVPAAPQTEPAMMPAARSNGAISDYRPRSEFRTMASVPISKPVRERPKWVIPGIALAVAVVMLLIWSKLTPRGTSVPKPATAAQQTLAPAPADVIAPATPAPRPPPATPAVAVRNPAAASRAWYVVVATYSDKSGAAKRARSVTDRWPRFRAQVFGPPVGDSHYLVVIGSKISQEEAAAMRDRARAAGLPQDVYIKKF